MVVDRKPLLHDRYQVLHNIGQGPRIEDVLFEWKITGHFRYYGSGSKNWPAAFTSAAVGSARFLTHNQFKDANPKVSSSR